MTEQIHRLSEEQEDRILLAGGHLPPEPEREWEPQVESPEPDADVYDDTLPPHAPPSGYDG
ncbi:MAG TPA: hypothetical protein VFY17_11660 [Pilimelia sp.]|nr:hypothetical protein [Pilimelia sp.]